MNLTLKSAVVVAAFAAAAFAQDATPAVSEASSAETAAKADAAYTNLEQEVPESAPTAVRGESAPTEVASPVAEATPGVEPAPVAEPVSAQETPATSAPVASADPVAPQAVRNGESSARPAAQPAARPVAKQTYVERVYIGMDGNPVHTVYVAEQSSGKDTVTMDQLMGRYPMEFKIGVQASIHSYFLSNGEYGDWDEESFDGLSWRAGISALIPLNEYTMGVKLGVLYEQSNASENYYMGEAKIPTHFKFEQKKLDIPVLFTFKSANSRFYFDMGAQLSIPLQDELKVSYTDPDSNKKIKSSADLMDDDYRNTLDWSLVFGFSVMPNKYVSLDVRAELGLSDLYDGYLNTVSDKNAIDLNLSTSSFGIGVTLYPF